MDNEVDEILQKRYDAILYLDFNKPLEAMRLFNECIALDNANAGTYNELGLIYYSRFTNYSEARIYYEKALAIDSESSSIYYSYALALEQLGFYKEAYLAYTKAVEYGDDIFFIARSYLSMIDIHSYYHEITVSELYDKAKEVAPSFFFIYHHEALWYMNNALYEEALSSIQEAIRHNQYYTASHYIASCLYVALEQWDYAIEHAHRAVIYSEEDERYKAWYDNLLSVYEQYLRYTKDISSIVDFCQSLLLVGGYSTIQRILDEYEESKAIFGTCAEYDSIQSRILYIRAMVALQYQCYEQGLEYIEKFFVNRGKSYALLEIAIYEVQALLYEGLSDYASMALCYTEIYSLCAEEEQGSYAYKAGEAYMCAERYEEAVQWLYEAYRLDTRRERLYTYSSALFYNNMVKEGIEALSILRTFPMLGDNQIQHCVELLYKSRAYRECLRWCELWKVYNPSNYLAYYYGACCRYARQYLQEALNDAKKAVLLSPHNELCTQLESALVYHINKEECAVTTDYISYEVAQ